MIARALILALFFIASLFSFSCADNDSENVNISAAASLQNVLNDLKLIYEAKYDGNLIINYAGSYTLSFQINEGMKSDVFIPAGGSPVQKLENKQFDVQPFLSNKLVLISNKKIYFTEWSSENLKIFKRIAIADPRFSPAGEYSLEAINSLDNSSELISNLVFAKDVSATLSYVKRGLADIGIVYLSDSIKDSQIYTSDVIPEDAYSRIEYPIVTFSNMSKKTEHFLEFLIQKESITKINEEGFVIHD